MVETKSLSNRANFRRFFFRGLAILLPSVLTIWILIAAYGFVQVRIAGPINHGVQVGLSWSPWPVVVEEEVLQARQTLTSEELKVWRESGEDKDWLRRHARLIKIRGHWNKYAYATDQIGLIIAILLIYFVGMLVGSFIGHRIYARAENFVKHLPLVRQVYPAVKQITDFLFPGEDAPLRFNRVVAVEYPRRGIWSVGFITGDTMRAIQDRLGKPCSTVFIPSSPTPFTGYTITVPKEDIIDLPITVEDALRFTVSGGVVLPPSQTPYAALSTSSPGEVPGGIPGGSPGKVPGGNPGGDPGGS